VKQFSKLSYMYFLYFPFFTPGRQPYFEISEMTTHTPMNRARDIWWTLDFASAFLSPGVNSRGELVPSPGAYARNGERRWLRDNNYNTLLRYYAYYAYYAYFFFTTILTLTALLHLLFFTTILHLLRHYATTFLRYYAYYPYFFFTMLTTPLRYYPYYAAYYATMLTTLLLAYQAITDWNNLDRKIKLSTSISTFKRNFFSNLWTFARIIF
jgi:hypothetical protein